MQNRCFYRNSSLHEAYSCRTNVFIEFIVDRRNTLFCRMLLNGCLGNQTQIIRHKSASTVIPVFYTCFYISFSFLKMYGYIFAEHFSRRRELMQKLPELLFKQSIRDDLQNTEAVVQSWPKACNFIRKETLTQVFSCQFCEIFKNTFFRRTPLVAASENSYQSNFRYCKLRKVTCQRNP